MFREVGIYGYRGLSTCLDYPNQSMVNRRRMGTRVLTTSSNEPRAKPVGGTFFYVSVPSSHHHIRLPYILIVLSRSGGSEVTNSSRPMIFDADQVCPSVLINRWGRARDRSPLFTRQREPVTGECTRGLAGPPWRSECLSYGSQTPRNTFWGYAEQPPTKNYPPDRRVLNFTWHITRLLFCCANSHLFRGLLLRWIHR